MCAICLESYKVGDSIAWSINNQCQHVYHLHCIVSYLGTLKRKYNTPCPNCRQNFMERPPRIDNTSEDNGNNLDTTIAAEDDKDGIVNF